MSDLLSDVALLLWIALWLATASFLMFRHWRPESGVGLILGYVVSFGAMHWLSAALNLLPWYETWNPAFVREGMRQSALAMLAFAVGAEFVHRRLRSVQIEDAGDAPVDQVSVNLYLAAGVIMHVLLAPLARNIPSVNALVGTGSTLFVTGVGLKCWTAWHAGDRWRVGRWLALSMALPFFTVATQGFLGYGMSAMLTVFVFVAAFYGPRKHLLVAGALVGYLGLSIYVTYMRDRAEIRSVVWGGSSLGDRVDSVANTLAEMEWFNVYDVQHLNRIEIRLNQNQLIGAAVSYVRSGRVPFAYGATFGDAALAVIPRALWPDKPMTAGSGDLVSTYTGIEFMEGTSVGIGQVMEAYVNFGTLGVLLTFLVIGGALTLVDRSSLAALTQGNLQAFTLWFLPGLSLIQLGGSFVEVTSTAAASFVVALLLNAVTRRIGAGRSSVALNDLTDVTDVSERIR